MPLSPCRFPRTRVQSKCIHLLIFKRGKVHCAWDSYLHQTIDKSLLSVAPPSLQNLDQTGHCHLSHGGDADRPSQKQVRTRGRKRAPSKASHYPPSTHQTTCLCSSGSLAARASRKNGSNMETSAVHCAARDALAVAPSGIQAVLEIQVQSGTSQTEDLPRDRGLNQRNGSGQPTVGSRTDPGRIAQARSSRLQTHDTEIHETGAHCRAARTELENLLTDSCPADLDLRLSPGHRLAFPVALCLLHHRITLSQSDPCRRHTIAYRCLDCATAKGRHRLWRGAEVPHPG